VEISCVSGKGLDRLKTELRKRIASHRLREAKLRVGG